jgi:glycosyltransferase involved in cell wall biosynthesis
MGEFFIMKVLLTAGIYPPDIGGPATFVPNLAEHLADKGHECEIIALKPKGFSQKPTNYKLTLIPRHFLLLRFVKSTLSILFKAARTETVFSNGLYLESAPALRILRKRSLAKIVGDPIWERERNRGTTNLSLMEFQRAKLTLGNKVLRIAYKFALNSYALIICPSEELVEVLTSWGVSAPVICIPNGVDIQSPIHLDKTYDLIYVGRLVKWKNVDQVIQISAANHLSTAIIGKGPLDMELKTLSTSLNSNCSFLGEMSKDQVLRHLNKSKFFILLSQYEGLSFALLEAMSCGLPVIVSNAKGNTDVVTDSIDGLIVDLENPEIKVIELCEILKDESRYAQMSSQARETIARKYESRKILDQYMNLMVS